MAALSGEYIHKKIAIAVDVDVNFFFFNDTATTEIYTLSLHDALPIRGDITEQLHQHGGEAVDRVGLLPGGGRQITGQREERSVGEAVPSSSTSGRGAW